MNGKVDIKWCVFQVLGNVLEMFVDGVFFGKGFNYWYKRVLVWFWFVSLISFVGLNYGVYIVGVYVELQ